MRPCEYKQAFERFTEANAAAYPTKGVHGMKMVAYRCPFCGKYHVGKRAKHMGKDRE